VSQASSSARHVHNGSYSRKYLNYTALAPSGAATRVQFRTQSGKYKYRVDGRGDVMVELPSARRWQAVCGNRFYHYYYRMSCVYYHHR
jgi:hypothetical protein